MPLHSRRFPPVVLVVVSLLLGLAGPQPALAQDPDTPVPLIGEVRSGRLPNGLSYFIRRNSRPEGRADLRLLVNAGSILEDDDQRGAAHFVEHMLFNGTKRFPKNELVSQLQSLGIRLGGDLNAHTGFDETIYVLPVPVGDPQLVETGLTILREWAANASFNDEDIEAERGVVLAEARSGQAADARVRAQTMPRMFNGSRYAARLPIGTDESIRRMRPDALRRFYRDWYRPDLMAVVAVGEIDPDHIEARIKALFSDIPARMDPRPRPERVEIPPRATADALLVTDRELPSGRVDVTTYIRPQPSMATVGAYDAILKDLLVNRMFGMRLYEMMDRPVRPFLAAQAQRQPVVRGYEAFMASAAIAGQDPVETAKLLATEIERARRFGFSEVELDAAKRDIVNRYAQAASERETADSGALADELGRHYFTDEPVPGIAWEYARVQQVVPAVTLEDINAHAQLVLTDPEHEPFVLVTAPTAQGATEAALETAVQVDETADITPYRGVTIAAELLDKKPQPGKVASEKADAALGTTTIEYANGVKVVLKPTGFKSNQILLTGGRYGGQYLYDERDHQNAAHLVQTIEAMGYGELTPTALTRYLGTRQANVRVSFEPYTEEVDGGSTGEELETLLQLVYLKLTAPRLDAERFRANREAEKGYVTALWNSPMSRYEDFTMAMLSQDHPRADRVPRPEHLDRVDPARSVEIYKERFGNAAGFTFVLVGSFDPAQVKPLLAQYLGGLPGSSREAAFRDVGLRYPTRSLDRTLEVGSDNSALTILYTGAQPYSPEERLRLAALTEVLRLRVIDRIREELGSAYSPGVSSQFTSVPVGQYVLRLGIGCSPDQVPVVQRTVDAIVAELQAKGPTPAELEKVTRTWLNEHDARTRTNEYWARWLRTRALDPARDDGPDYPARVKALTAADVQAAAKTYADPARRLRLVLAPQPAAVVVQ